VTQRKEALAMKERNHNGFGPRLAKIRRGHGLTQVQLGKAVGVSDRVIAYYESESAQPPGAMLPDLAGALSVSTDELLGVKPFKINGERKTSRRLRRIHRIEDLPPADQRAVLKFLDALLEKRGTEKGVKRT
jgi:transcriptional regulator with XRE-family HTH domain